MRPPERGRSCFGAAVLPDQRASQRPSAPGFKKQGAFPLVIQTDRQNVRRLCAGLFHGRADRFKERCKKFLRVMFRAAGAGVILRHFAITLSRRVKIPIKKNGCGAGCSFVNTEKKAVPSFF